MENQPQPKKGKAKYAYIIVSIIVIFVLGVAIFYFMPVPANLDKQSKTSKIQRCFYKDGIGYSTVVAGGDVSSLIFFDAKGNKICSTGGFSGKMPEGPCDKNLCFSIYGQ